MTIKMIAVDMDGTFLDKESRYDKERFFKIYKQLKQRNIHFVVASGNPLKQLKGKFEEIKDELTYIAENGGHIVEEEKELYLSYLNDKDQIRIIEALKNMPDVLCWACTKNQSYTLNSLSEDYFQMFLPFFPGVIRIQDFSGIKDPIIKFALYLPKKNLEERISDFSSLVSDRICVVDSGHYCVDLISSTTNKGRAIEFLMERYHLNKDEIMAFGDAGNDKEMLEKVTYGYAMNNAKEEFKSLFNYIAPSHIEQGVLEVIEKYLLEGTMLNLK